MSADPSRPPAILDPTRNPRPQAPGPAATCLIALLALVALTAFYMLGAGTMLLGEPDEARSALIARHMIQTGDYVAPYLLDHPYFDKPPLFFWMLAGSIKLFGENEWALRLPPALITAATVILTGLLAGQFFGRRAGWIAAATFALSAAALVNARIVRMDMFLALWVTATLLCWSRAFLPLPQTPNATPQAPSSPSPATSHWPLATAFLMYLCMALGCLTKGPIAIALPGLIMLVYMVLSVPLRRIPRLVWAMRPLLGLLIVLALYGTWVALMTRRYPEYPAEFFGRQNLDRFAGSGMNASVPRSVILGTFLGGLMPWFLLVGLAAWDRRPRRAIPPIEKLLWIWAAVVLAIFTISKGRMPNYVLPAFPPTFALLGAYLADAADQRRTQLRHGLFATLALFAPLLVGATLFARIHFNQTLYVPAAIALTILGILIQATAFLWERRPALALLPLLLGTALGAAAFARGPAQLYCASRSTRALVDPLAELDPAVVGEIGMGTEPRYGAVFYAPRWQFRHFPMREIKSLLPLLQTHDKPLYMILTGGGLLGMLQRDEISGLHVSDRLTILQRCDSDALVRIDPPAGPATTPPTQRPRNSQADAVANENHVNH